MTSDVRTIPEGYGTVTPWIIVRDCAGFLDYLKRAFNAEEIARLPDERGKIGHAEARIGHSIVMTFDAGDDWPTTPAFLRLYVEDGDAVQAQAIAAGGVAVTDRTDLFFGERVGRVKDPWGNLWWIHQRVEEVALEEMARRASDPASMAAMGYVQDSLRAEMSNRAQP
jgi:PhnB protein